MPQEAAKPNLSAGIRFLAILMALALLAQAGLDAEARKPLRGSASFTRTLGTPWSPSEYRIRQADQLAADYKLDAAEAIYREVLSQNPRNAGAWNGLGKTAWARTTSSNQNLRDKAESLHSTAIQHFMTALRYQPNYVEARVNLAGIYMEQGRMAEAREALEQALELSPDDDNALARKGEWLVRQGEHNEALLVLREAIRRNSANPTAQFYMGVAHLGRGELDEAHARLQMVLHLDPHNAPAHYQLGLLYEKQGNGAASIEEYRKALSLKPELHEARLKLADAYEKRGDWTSAIEHLKSVLASAPGSWDLVDRIGRLSVKNNQPEVAVKVYRQWMDTHAEDTHKAAEGLSWAKVQVARKKLRDDDLISRGEAQRYAEQALKYQPNNFEARLIDARYDREIGQAIGRQAAAKAPPGMVDVAMQKTTYQPHQFFEKGELLLSRYQFAEAEQAFRTAGRSSLSSKDQMIFGELFLSKGLPHLAEDAFRQVLRELPDNASARLGLSKAIAAREQARQMVMEAQRETRKERLDWAIARAEEALRLDAWNAQAHYLLGQLYERKRIYSDAADHYYAYLALSPGAENYRSIQQRISNLKRKISQGKI